MGLLTAVDRDEEDWPEPEIAPSADDVIQCMRNTCMHDIDMHDYAVDEEGEVCPMACHLCKCPAFV